MTVVENCKPNLVAAAAVYIAAYLSGQERSLQEVADAAKVPYDTLRWKVKQIIELLNGGLVK